VAPVISNPAAGYASPLDRLGFGVLVGCMARSTLLSVPPAPTSFYMAQGDGGPPSIWVVRSRSGRVCEGKTRLGSGSDQQEIKLTLAVDKKQWYTIGRTCQNLSLAWVMNLQDNDGNTALHLAVKAGSIRISALLAANRKVDFEHNRCGRGANSSRYSAQ
jgi:hypothetical protein